jgi:hypothetical protein
MFEMVGQASSAEDRKARLYKIGMTLVALAAVSGILFLCVRALS